MSDDEFQSLFDKRKNIRAVMFLPALLGAITGYITIAGVLSSFVSDDWFVVGEIARAVTADDPCAAIADLSAKAIAFGIGVVGLPLSMVWFWQLMKAEDGLIAHLNDKERADFLQFEAARLEPHEP